jgi:tRNA(Ile)-lysidine synthase
MPTAVVRTLRRTPGDLVFAVSGGLDSMVLLHMAASTPDVRRRMSVATFDHATGTHAQAAVALVRAAAESYNLPMHTQRAESLGVSEAEWRAMRWRFLNSVAEQSGARVVTGHTRDDQIETVVMRLLRGASARGLAALYADSSVVRPLLSLSRATLERYARSHRLSHVEDPTNSDRRYLRNRVRHDLLPALRAVRPTFDRDMLAIAREAARVRREIETIARSLSRRTQSALEMDVASFGGLNREAIAILWPAFVARLGVALDRRGVQRATDFALTSRTGHQAQCSGGIRLRRTRQSVVVTREPSASYSAETLGAQRPVEPLGGPTSYSMGGPRVS